MRTPRRRVSLWFVFCARVRQTAVGAAVVPCNRMPRLAHTDMGACNGKTD